MGTTTSKQKNLIIQHQKFSQAKILSQEQLQIQIRSTSNDYNIWKHNIKKINSFPKQNIIFPINHAYQQEGWCSKNAGIVKITYDNYQFVFEEQLENRITLGKHLSQQEMWYLLYTLVSTAQDFNAIGKKVGDIRPQNIFVSEAGQIKLAVCYSWPGQTTNYQKTLLDKQITYISPQQLNSCKTQSMQTILSNITCQSFSIGLTMLHAGLLYNFVSIYNLEKFQMNTKLLEDKINQWMNLEFTDQDNNLQTYSHSLRQIVANLCRIDKDKRENSLEVYKMLQPYKQHILNIQPFQFKYAKNQDITFKNNYFPSTHLEAYSSLQNNSGVAVYNYSQLAKSLNVNQSQTPKHVNPIMDWSHRNFAPPVKIIQPSTHYEFFDKYARSNNQTPYSPNQPVIKFINSSHQQYEPRPSFGYNNQKVIIQPFSTISEEQTHNYNQYENATHIHNIQSNMKIQNKVDKHTQSRNIIGYYTQATTQQIIHPSIQKIEAWKSNQYDPTEFLRKIDEQLQKSKNMFPS